MLPATIKADVVGDGWAYRLEKPFDTTGECPFMPSFVRVNPDRISGTDQPPREARPDLEEKLADSLRIAVVVANLDLK